MRVTGKYVPTGKRLSVINGTLDVVIAAAVFALLWNAVALWTPSPTTTTTTEVTQ